MITLKEYINEGVLGNIDANISKMDDDINENFPSIKDFKSHPALKCTYIIWPCQRLCQENVEYIRDYFRNQTMMQTTIVNKVQQINGISMHVCRTPYNEFKIEMFFEGIERGAFTNIGIVVPNLVGQCESKKEAMQTAYNFLLQFKNDRSKFTEVLKQFIQAAKTRKDIDIKTLI